MVKLYYKKIFEFFVFFIGIYGKNGIENVIIY